MDGDCTVYLMHTHYMECILSTMIVYLVETVEWISHILQNLIQYKIILNNTIGDGLLYEGNI